jgi:hypothetical protein
MADLLTRNPVSPIIPVTMPTGPTGPYGGIRAGGTLTNTIPLPGDTVRAPLATTNQFPGAITTPTTGLPGSSLDTLYGVDSESYLTEDQRKLARQIQGKFDASLNSRNRALQQYGAPRLSSFAEDEALARAMTLASGLNYRPEDTTKAGGVRTQAAGLPTGGTRYTPPTTAPTAPTNTGALNNASWQRVLAGLTSIVPLLFGRDAYGQFLNKGLIQSVKDTLFGPGSQISDAHLQQIIEQGGMPTNGPITYNPITGEPMVINPEFTPGGLGDPWGTASGWGQDVIPTTDWWTTPDTSSLGSINTWDFGSLAGP